MRLSLSCFFLTLLAPTAHAYTLEACYDRAVARSAQLVVETASIEQAEQRIAQAEASFLPSLSLQSSYLRQDPSPSPLAANISPEDQTVIKANLNQNLFRGLRDLAALQQRTYEQGAASAARAQAFNQLYLDVARAFYNVLSYRSALSEFAKEFEVVQQRRQELAGLKRLGRARDVDLVTTEVSLANLEASQAMTRGLLGSALETLSFLTGLEPTMPLEELDRSTPTLAPLASWLSQVEQRPDLSGAQQSLLALDSSIKAVRAEHLPSLDFDSNYYFKRSGINADSKWDLLLSLKVPLFNGGLTSHRVGEVQAQRQGQEARLQQLRRQATQDIRSAYVLVQTEIEQLKKLEAAHRLSTRNYELMRADNRLGLATNIELLQILSNDFSLRRNLSQVQYTIKYDFKRLEVLAARKDLAAASLRRQKVQ